MSDNKTKLVRLDSLHRDDYFMLKNGKKVYQVKYTDMLHKIWYWDIMSNLCKSYKAKPEKLVQKVNYDRKSGKIQ